MEAFVWKSVGHGVDVSVIFLEAAICVADNISAYVGRGYPRQCIQAYMFHSEQYQHAQNVGNGPTKIRQIQLSKNKA